MTSDAEKIRVLRDALERIQWLGTPTYGHPICPLCFVHKTEGHSPKCQIGSALSTTEPAPHVTRHSDSTFYDEVCINCGATDANGMGALNAPCSGVIEPAPRDSSALGETWQPDPQRCPICDWPYAAERKDGCVPGNCSYRPSGYDRESIDRIKRNWARYEEWKQAQPAAGEGGE